MKLSIQRQCDGPYVDPSNTLCDARLELEVTVPDGQVALTWKQAWEGAAFALGWRRIGGDGQDISRPDGPGARVFYIPSAKTWVVCPACATRTELVGDGFDVVPG